MKSLLIASENFECNSKFRINTNLKTIYDILTELADKTELNNEKKIVIDVLIIPAEQTINLCLDGNFSGIELIKHIRLTPELKEINKVPIILLHWHSLDYYITKDKENIFLYSPSIYNYRLPYDKVDFSKIDLQESLIPYLFGSKNDETKSIHHFRNELGIKQFDQQLNNPMMNILNQGLWFKKIFKENFRDIEFDKSQSVHPIKAPIRILFADDMADKWEIPLRKIITQAHFIPCIDQLSIETALKNLSLFDESNVKRLMSISDLRKRVVEIDSFINSISKDYINVMLLDVNFKNDQTGNISESDGYKALEYLQLHEFKIPVIIFSATSKNIDIFYKTYEFIVGHYIKSYSPINDLLHYLKKSHQLSALTSIANQAQMLIGYKGKFNIICAGIRQKVDDYHTMKIKHTLNSIIDKIYIISIWKIDFLKKEENITKQLSEIIALLGVIQDYYYKNPAQSYSIEAELLGFRNSTYHLYKETQYYKDWKKLDFFQKTAEIQNFMSRTIKGLLFGM